MVRFTSVFSLSLLSVLATAAPSQSSVSSGFNLQDAAVSYTAKQWGVSSFDVWFDHASPAATGSLAVLRQEANAQPIWNSFAHVSFDKDNKVVSFDSKTFPISFVEVNMPTISVEEAAAVGEKVLGAKWTDVDFQYTEPDNLGYIAVDGSAKYVFILNFEKSDGSTYTAYISAVDGSVNWVVDASGATVSL